MEWFGGGLWEKGKRVVFCAGKVSLNCGGGGFVDLFVDFFRYRLRGGDKVVGLSYV